MVLSRLIRRAGCALAAAVLVGSAVTACGSSTGSSSAPLTYAPAAYGQQAGKVFDCYYISWPSEGASLEAAGLCPVGSMATPMPLSWEQEYWAWYSSPAFYNAYVPAADRSTYTRVTVVHFSSTYKTQISSAEARAVYKSSSGTRVTGTSKLKFSSGSKSANGSSAVHGGGSVRGTCSLGVTVVHMRSSGGSGGHGGGSARSGGVTKTTVKAKTGSGARGGC